MRVAIGTMLGRLESVESELAAERAVRRAAQARQHSPEQDLAVERRERRAQDRLLEEDSEALRRGCKNLSTGRSRKQSTCDLSSRSPQVTQACCPVPRAGHWRMQERTLIGSCPSVSCARAFLPFLDECYDVMAAAAMPIADFERLGAQCQQLSALRSSKAQPALIFKVNIAMPPEPDRGPGAAACVDSDDCLSALPGWACPPSDSLCLRENFCLRGPP
jgi:hypothetical protein